MSNDLIKDLMVHLKSRKGSYAMRRDCGKAADRIEELEGDVKQGEKANDFLRDRIEVLEGVHEINAGVLKLAEIRFTHLEAVLRQIGNATIDKPNVVAEDFQAIANEALK